MSDAFFGRLVPSEDLTIKTANLVVSLKKVSADDAKGLGMKEGPAKFKLPGNIGNIGGGSINAKVRRIPLANISPYFSHNFIFDITVTSGVSTKTCVVLKYSLQQRSLSKNAFSQLNLKRRNRFLLL